MKNCSFSFSYAVCSPSELTEADQKLCLVAIEASRRSYAPYSEFHVGAAVLLNNGIILSGNNQENAAYPSGLCAERCAVFYANAQYPDVPIHTLAIAATNQQNELTRMPITPCGSCRQVLIESEARFQNNIRLLLYGAEQVVVVSACSYLLPFSFSDKSLQ